MAFALDVIVGSLTSVQSLSDGNPFSLEGATGLAMAPVRRLTEQAPRQDGDTDLGYRLDPRTITLSLNFTATSYSDLDTYRDLLINIFRPIRGYSVLLRVTRDDGEVRQIECQTVGPVDVRLVREERAGKVHRAVVQLRAANPLWYDPASQSLALDDYAQWFTAGGEIEDISGQGVKHWVTYPAVDEAWGISGTAATWTVAFRSGDVPFAALADLKYAFNTSSQYFRTADVFDWNSSGQVTEYQMVGADYGDVMTAGTQNYFVDSAGDIFRGTARVGGPDAGVASLSYTNARWRGNAGGAARQWTADLVKAVVISRTLDSGERAALNTYMARDYDLSGTIAYTGDFPEYPVFTVTGPVSDLVIHNLSTGGSIDLSGALLAVGETYTIDLQAKTVLAGTVTHFDEVVDKDDFVAWALQPSPVVTGGTNVIAVNAGSANTGFSVSMQYYNRFVSF